MRNLKQATGHGTPRDTVLVADPDPVLRQSIGEVLRRAGIRVLAQADSTEEAYGLLRKLDPAVLILGLLEPDRELLQVMRRPTAGNSRGVVLLSPIPDLEWIRAVRGAGIDTLLGRPPREADLVAAVELCLGRRESSLRTEAELGLLRERLDTSTAVQRAKEVLMRREQISDGEAYQRLRRQAERTGRPLRSIAEAVLLAASVAPEPPTPRC